MEPAYHGIEEETVTRLPSKAFVVQTDADHVGGRGAAHG